jgi:hypothetical protein
LPLLGVRGLLHVSWLNLAFALAPHKRQRDEHYPNDAKNNPKPRLEVLCPRQQLELHTELLQDQRAEAEKYQNPSNRTHIFPFL